MARDTQLWIMVDIVTSGPVVGTHSMTELGAAVGSMKHVVISRFDALIRPIGTAVATNPESFARAKNEGIDPQEAMKNFATWCAPFQKFNAIFIARPAAFDWPWIVWYARTYLGGNPFGFRAVCALSWFLAKDKKFDDSKLTSAAARDAETQLRQFLVEA
jgi:hypothetical protein